MNVQADNHAVDTNYIDNIIPASIPWETLPQELILQILSLLGTQLPRVSRVCQELKNFSADRVLLVEELKAFELWTKKLVENNPNQAKVLEEMESLKANWKENYWKAFGGISQFIGRLLTGLTPKQLAALDIPMIDLSKAPLMRHYLQNQFTEAWKKIILAATSKGSFTMPWGWEFTHSSFREFLKAMKDIPSVKSFSIEADLSNDHIGIFADFIQKHEFSFEYININPDRPFSRDAIIELFKSFAFKPNLRGINFYNDLFDREIQQLEQSLRNNHVFERLVFQKYTFSPAGMQSLIELAKNHPTMQTLCLKAFSAQDIDLLLNDLNNTKLSTLIITHGELTDNQANRLAALLQTNRTLKKLDITNNVISKDALEIIVPVMHTKQGFEISFTGEVHEFLHRRTVH